MTPNKLALLAVAALAGYLPAMRAALPGSSPYSKNRMKRR